METNIAGTIDITSQTAKYDASVKELLADKQILVRILKYSLEDFAKEELSDIMEEMDEPIVSGIRVEPGFTNTEKIQQDSQEDSVPGEGGIYYDIRFSVYHGEEKIKIIINIEAQKSTDPNKLGYQIDNRVIFYLSRMISAQKEVEFHHSDYDNIKNVRSIWICMDSGDDEDSINRIRFEQENVYGKRMKLPNIGKVQGVIIRLRKNENVETSKNNLIAMLEELLKKESAEDKKKKLEQVYDLRMSDVTKRRINTMCNLSEVLLDQGMDIGADKKIVEQVCKKIAKGQTVEEIADALEESIEKIQLIYDEAMKQKPDYDVNRILQAIR